MKIRRAESGGSIQHLSALSTVIHGRSGCSSAVALSSRKHPPVLTWAANARTILDAANSSQKQCFSYDNLDRLTKATTYNDSTLDCPPPATVTNATTPPAIMARKI